MMVAGIIGGIAVALLIIAPIIMGDFDPASPLILAPLTALPVVAAYLLSAAARSFSAPSPASPATPTTTASERAALAIEPSLDDAKPIPFYSNYIYRDYLCWLLTFGVIITLAIVAPWGSHGELAHPVDLGKPLITPEGIHPEWYFMFAFQLLRTLPGTAAMLALIVVGLLWLAVPWIDRGAERRNVAVFALGAALLIAFVALTAWGYLAPAE